MITIGHFKVGAIHLPTIVLLAGCTAPRHDVAFDTRNWMPGDTIWYTIQLTDSVLGPTGDRRTKELTKAIQYTIVDTTEGPTIEWLEFHLLEPIAKDSGRSDDQREWVMMHRLVYRCDRMGSIEKVLNYPEVKARVDTLIDHFLGIVGLTEEEQAKLSSMGFRDSTWVITSLLREAEILHRTFGLKLGPLDTLELISLQPISEQGTLPYHVRLSDPSFCADGEVGWYGWGEQGKVDLGKFLSSHLGNWDQLDSLNMGTVSGKEEMSLCFDPSRSIPTYVSMIRTLRMDFQELVQRIEIFEMPPARNSVR